MKLGNFSIVVTEGKEQPNGYVEMKHNTVYQLVLQNDASLNADARVEVDGKHIGTWRLPAYGSIRLERPANETGRFTFYQLGTTEAVMAGLEKNEFLGLISVTFMPEKQRDWPKITNVVQTEYMTERATACAPASKAYNAGGTGLSGHSNQQFSHVAKLDYDENAFVTINLRLVATENASIRPLKPISTPIPPSVI